MDAGRARDGGWPSGAALQGEASNHRKLRRSRAGVVSVAAKGALTVRQVRARKANASEPPRTCRNRMDGIETEGNRYLGKNLGDNLLTAQVVPGIVVARAWLRLWCGTWEPVASRAAVGLGERPARPSKGEPQAAETARGRVPMRGTGADCPVVARKPGNAGGAKGADCSGSFGGQPRRSGRS